MDRVIIVSADSHAQMPPERWPEYLDARFHHLLPQLHRENETYPRAMWLLSSRVINRPDMDLAHRAGGAYLGVRDAKIRIEQMDEEGIAAELVYIGDFRSTDPFCNIVNGNYPFDAWDAGTRAYHRWAADEFGAASDRLLLCGAIGSCTDMAATVAELDWIAAHGFKATFLPGFVTRPGMPALSDEYWDPFWQACVRNGLALVVHAGYGFSAGVVYPDVERICQQADASRSSDAELLARLVTDVFNGGFFADVKPRRPLVQLTLGGVFDRHPELRLLLTEIRADWIPATLRHLDDLWTRNRDAFPAMRAPSEVWHGNCLAGASFAHKAEVEMRHEIGVENFLFGRDYPHPEGTWPHTSAWLRHAFAGVPEHELRLMLGENAIRFCALDRSRLAEIAARVGPTVGDLIGDGPPVDEELVGHFDLRGGYLRAAEGAAKLGLVDDLVREDFAGVTP